MFLLIYSDSSVSLKYLIITLHPFRCDLLVFLIFFSTFCKTSKVFLSFSRMDEFKFLCYFYLMTIAVQNVVLNIPTCCCSHWLLECLDPYNRGCCLIPFPSLLYMRFSMSSGCGLLILETSFSYLTKLLQSTFAFLVCCCW